MVKRGGVYDGKRKADESVVDSSPPTKKPGMDEILKYTGNDMRFELVQLWRKEEFDKYNGLVDGILGNKTALNNLLNHLNRNITTFSIETLLALDKFFRKLYGINNVKSDEYLKILSTKYSENEKINMPALVERLIQYYLTNNNEAYNNITQKIINDFKNYGTKEFFDYLDENIKIEKDKDGKTIIVASTFSEEQLLALLKTLTQIQEDAVAYGNSMEYLEAISNMANKLQPPITSM
jgi:hypothetical protein